MKIIFLSYCLPSLLPAPLVNFVLSWLETQGEELGNCCLGPFVW